MTSFLGARMTWFLPLAFVVSSDAGALWCLGDGRLTFWKQRVGIVGCPLGSVNHCRKYAATDDFPVRATAGFFFRSRISLVHQ